jgi:hypothetical protein
MGATMTLLWCQINTTPIDLLKPQVNGWFRDYHRKRTGSPWRDDVRADTMTTL